VLHFVLFCNLILEVPLSFSAIRRAFVLPFLVLAACAAEPTQAGIDMNAIYTQMVGTLSVSIQETQSAVMASLATPTFLPTLTPTNTFLPTPTVATSTPLPTWTNAYVYVAPTATFATLTLVTPGTPGTVNPNMLAAGCNNLLFIRDETIPAGTEVKAGEDFIKIWKVANNGTCEWKYQYRLALLSGDSFDAFVSPIGKIVEVNEWAELKVSIQAPNQPGTYKNYWRLSDLDGKMFGATLELSFVVK
jgi:hypothetical protein